MMNRLKFFSSDFVVKLYFIELLCEITNIHILLHVSYQKMIWVIQVV